MERKGQGAQHKEDETSESQARTQRVRQRERDVRDRERAHARESQRETHTNTHVCERKCVDMQIPTSCLPLERERLRGLRERERLSARLHSEIRDKARKTTNEQLSPLDLDLACSNLQ